MELLKCLLTKYRKHKYDLDNPKYIKTQLITLEGKPYILEEYTCTVCGTSLMLSKEQMQKLPFDMARGCTGYQPKYNTTSKPPKGGASNQKGKVYE